MRRRVTAAVVVLGLAAAGGAWWYRAHAEARRLDDARRLVGTRAADAALDDLRRRYPDRPEVYLLSARQDRLAGRSADAWLRLERAAELGAPAAAVERERALGRPPAEFPQARPTLDRLLVADPDDADVLLSLADGELLLGHYEEAAALADRAVARAPDDARALAVRGEAWLRARRLDHARADLTAATADPDALAFPRARLALATCLLDLGEFGAAHDLFAAARRDDPDDRVAAFGVGRTAGYLGRLAEADEAFGAVLAVRPGHVETLLSRSHVAEQRGDLPRALDYLERAERAEPRRRETHSALARVLGALGRDDQAAAHEARFRELDPAAQPDPKEMR